MYVDCVVLIAEPQRTGPSVFRQDCLRWGLLTAQTPPSAVPALSGRRQPSAARKNL